jgi:hypothetical protein
MIESRKVKRAGNVARMEEKYVHSWFWCLNLTERYNFEALGVSRRIVLKYIFKNRMG